MSHDAPSGPILDRLFGAHLEEHRRLPESARVRDLGAERALVQDYSGRVVYELLQNALDRAEERIRITWRPSDGVLEVANDGRPVSAYPTGEGVDGDGPGQKRSDFHALLSLHSSSKTASESIGNKGVGFRSVFASATSVEVWSRTEDGAWWGMGMSHPASLEPVDPGHWTVEEVASFYHPLRLTDRPEGCEGFQTVVRLLGVKEKKAAIVTETVEALQVLPLVFLRPRVRQPDALRLEITCGTQTVTQMLSETQRGLFVRGCTQLRVSPGVRAGTGLEIQEANVRVMAYDRAVAHEGRSGRYWSYLPTEQAAGFGVDVHADFYLSNSRRSLAIRGLKDGEKDPTDPPGWNRRLVEIAAALIVDELWRDAEYCRREDFWNHAKPSACPCPHLRWSVTRRLLEREETFRDLTRATFPPGSTWPLSRYRAFFDALEDWAREGWAHRLHPNLYQMRRALLVRVEGSEAPVLPIIDGDPNADDAGPIAYAQPLVQRLPSRQSGEGPRVYHRREQSSLGSTLPPAVIAQGTHVTTFRPPGPDDLSQYGLIEFNRREILAALKPGVDESEHEGILLAALQLACERPAVGGDGSVLDRARDTAGGPSWRFTMGGDTRTTLARVAETLSTLQVPTVTDGWRPAASVSRAKHGPWPQVDEGALGAILSKLPDELRPTLDDATALLGVQTLPLDGTKQVLAWPEAPTRELGEEILGTWARDTSPWIGLDWARPARAVLSETPWLHADLSTASLGAELHPGIGAGGPYRPAEIWWQHARGGFRTSLLPRLVTVEGREVPLWARALGIESPRGTRDMDRIVRALSRLRGSGEARRNGRELSDLYRQLVEGILTLDDPLPEIPLLCRHIDQEGSLRGLEWKTRADGAWHDTGGETQALGAFTDVDIWVYRGAKIERALALGLKSFKPEKVEIKTKGEGAPGRGEALRDAIWEALPDLLAVAENSRNDLAADEFVRRQAILEVRSYDDVWVEWTFDGRTGSVGSGELGDVFLMPAGDGRHCLAFDGEDLPLTECAYPLSELLTDGRAFGTVFRDGLYAWSHGHNHAHVRRFRRNHNVTDEDVAACRERLASARLSPEEQADWRRRVATCLQRFGALVNEPRLGFVVHPGSFDVLSLPEATEDEVHKAIDAALADQERLRALAPRVAFAEHHQEKLGSVRIEPYIAAAADRLLRADWTEARLEELRERVRRPHAFEEAEVLTLGFDPDVALRRRLDLDPQVPLTSSGAATAFAHGMIPVRELPSVAASVTLKTFSPGGASTGALAALTSEQWLKRQRTAATGGARAEHAVLSLAVQRADEWRRRDERSFDEALDRVCTLLGDVGRAILKKRSALAGRPDALKDLLHVADHIGNAGFDVLVPDGERFLAVEIKRVQSVHQSAAFYLSENERRRAEEYAARSEEVGWRGGSPWRLWLVSGGGETRDVTQVLCCFERHRPSLDALLGEGIRPQEWFLEVEVGG